MVTVIADKEELPTPVNNGVMIGSNDNTERSFHYIKDYQEVDFNRSASCKPLPDDLFRLVDGETEKTSIKGTFFVQIDAIELLNQLSNDNNNQTDDNSSLLLTITDGISTVKGITNDSIPDLNSNIRPGCKLLLTGVIPIENGFLQLNPDNTRFQYGSNTYPRPRSAYRGRGGGSYRPSYEGRRGGGNSNSRYDNDDNESNFLKRPPPKTTLMAFMTSLKISNNDTKPINDNDNQKFKERQETKRRNPQEHYQTNKTNNGIHNNHHNSNNNNNHTMNTNHYYPTNTYPDQITFQPDNLNEQLDPEDDPTHSNYRERRNPLPPRLQRVQEERTRRNTNRYHDESIPLQGNDINSNYRNGTANNLTLSSTSSYSRRGDQTSYLQNNSSTGQQIPTNLNSYPPHTTNLIPSVNGTTQAHLAYYATNSGPLTYSLAGIPSPPFHNPSSSIGPSYPNESLAYCYGAPYATPTYLPPTVTNNFNGDTKHYNNTNTNNNYSSVTQTNSFVDENENKTANESQHEDNNENENKSQSSSSSSLNDANHNSQQVNNNEKHEDKRRDSNSNPRPRWRIGDMCLARWSEDKEFYPANIVQIHPPYCTVVFRDYNNYEQVHFGDLKVFPRDQQYYPYIPPMGAPTSDLNALAGSAYFPGRTNYYPSPIDGCILMPEAPPFPFNSAGTLYMCPPTMTSVPLSNRVPSYQQSNRRNENGNNHNSTNTTSTITSSSSNNNNNGNSAMDSIINSSSTPSKDSNDTSTIDSTDDNPEDLSLDKDDLRPCSIADAPLTLVTNDDERERSSSTESIENSTSDDQQLTNDEEKQEENRLN